MVPVLCVLHIFSDSDSQVIYEIMKKGNMPFSYVMRLDWYQYAFVSLAIAQLMQRAFDIVVIQQYIVGLSL